jgi:nucleoside-diphosphate-sugar epimerase
MNVLKLIGRYRELFEDDIRKFGKELDEIVHNSKFLVVGGAGSIGSAVVKEIFKRNPIAGRGNGPDIQSEGDMAGEPGDEGDPGTFSEIRSDERDDHDPGRGGAVSPTASQTS